MGDFAKEYAEALYDSLGNPVLICDRDTYIAVAGGSKKEYLNKNVSELIEKIMEDRHSVIESPKGKLAFVDSMEEEMQSYTAAPIIANGDPIGAVVILAKEYKCWRRGAKVCRNSSELPCPPNGTVMKIRQAI